MNIVRHYIWHDGERIGKPIDGSGNKDRDLEKLFPGLKYSKCKGLNDKGKQKNVHIEKYADSDELRVWKDPDGVLREATNITLELYFTGVDRHTVYDSFVGYISTGKIHYWDTERKREAFMVFIDESEPKEDVYKGSIPYILAEFKFQNLWGECPIKEISEL